MVLIAIAVQFGEKFDIANFDTVKFGFAQSNL